MFDKNWQKYIWELFHYVGIWFIWWALSHWFFSWIRSVIMVLLWAIIFIIWEMLLKNHNSSSSYGKILIIWLIYSLSVWMVNGWLQHFLDSPERSLLIIPLGFIISIIIFQYKESLWKEYLKNNFLSLFIFWVIVTLLMLGAYMILPESLYLQVDNHHD